MGVVKYTDEYYAKAVELYKKGMNASAVAKKTGINRATLGKYLKKLGIMRPDPHPDAMTGKLLKEARELYATGMSKREVAEKLGICLGTLSHHSVGWDRPHTKRGYDAPNAIGKEKTEAVVRLAKEGVSAADIAKQLEVKLTWVYTVANKHDIIFRNVLTESQKRQIYNRRESGELYKDIAKDLGRTVETVRYSYLTNKDRFGFEKRRNEVLQAYLLGDRADYTSERLGIPSLTISKMYANFRKDGIFPQN